LTWDFFEEIVAAKMAHGGITSLVDELRERLGSAAFASAVRRGASLNDGQIIHFVHRQIFALTG
jgi:hypothetical protein